MNTRSFSAALASGFIVINGLLIITGSRCQTPEIPLAAAGSGFVLMGLRYGMSERRQSLQGIFILTAINMLLFCFLTIRSNLLCFRNLTIDVIAANLLIFGLNSFMLSCAGNWAGGILSDTSEDRNKVPEDSSMPAWPLVIAASVCGLVTAVFLTAAISLFISLSLRYLLLALVAGSAAAGYLTGFRTSENMLNDGIAAGLTTSVLILTAYKFAFDPATRLFSVPSILLFLASGVIASFIGSMNGLKAQIKRENS